MNINKNICLSVSLFLLSSLMPIPGLGRTHEGSKVEKRQILPVQDFSGINVENNFSSRSFRRYTSYRREAVSPYETLARWERHFRVGPGDKALSKKETSRLPLSFSENWVFGHRYTIPNDTRELNYYPLAGVIAFADTSRSLSHLETTLSREGAIRVAKRTLAALGVLVESGTTISVAVNRFTDDFDEPEAPLNPSVYSYTVFLHSTVDGLQVAGGGMRSAVQLAGSESNPYVVGVQHFLNGVNPMANSRRVLRGAHLKTVDQALIEFRRGNLLLPQWVVDNASAARVVDVGQAHFANGRFAHAELIPAYAIRVEYELFNGHTTDATYLVSALSNSGWSYLGYSARERKRDSRYYWNRHNPKYESVPTQTLLGTPSERETYYASIRCLPVGWSLNGEATFGDDCRRRRATLEALPEFVPADEICEHLAESEDELVFVGTLRGSFPGMGSGWQRGVESTVSTGLINACWRPNSNFGTDGFVLSADYPFRPDWSDVKDADNKGTFYYHASHAWGDEAAECGAAAIYSGVMPAGISINPSLFPVIPPDHFTSCRVTDKWNNRLRYFYTGSSFGNAGRRQWTKVVGGGSNRPKIVIGNVSHGNRFDMNAVLDIFFNELAHKTCNSLIGCRVAGRTFTDAMREAVSNTATPDAAYGWLNPSNDPKIMRLVYSTRAQRSGETLPGWGPQFNNDSNFDGFAFEAEGDVP